MPDLTGISLPSSFWPSPVLFLANLSWSFDEPLTTASKFWHQWWIDPAVIYHCSQNHYRLFFSRRAGISDLSCRCRYRPFIPQELLFLCCLVSLQIICGKMRLICWLYITITVTVWRFHSGRFLLYYHYRVVTATYSWSLICNECGCEGTHPKPWKLAQVPLQNSCIFSHQESGWIVCESGCSVSQLVSQLVHRKRFGGELWNPKSLRSMMDADCEDYPLINKDTAYIDKFKGVFCKNLRIFLQVEPWTFYSFPWGFGIAKLFQSYKNSSQRIICVTLC